ncbi:MAG: alanine/glycine:cation symporter family protein [Coriobacteriia bacterium]|nr:alanine/glycine:cation symporter family protein [Coriobacteriia bacterium]
MSELNDMLVNLTGEIDTIMYTYILVILLVVAGVYFTIRTKGVQIRYFVDMFKHITEKKHVKEGEKAVSSFQAMMVSTASRVGTGNIAGVATAIAMGGPGAIFWMWLMAIFGAASAFVESTLAQTWKVKNKDGSFRGGPAYYIEQVLHQRWLGIIFAISLILCFAFGFNGLQAYNTASSLEHYFPDYATNGMAVGVGVFLAALTAFTIFGGSSRISTITSVVVPVMAIIYILLALVATITNVGSLPSVFGYIFQNAFDFQSIFGGFAGSCVMLGIKRGLFSNEAGMGSAPNAAAAASVSHPVKQGLIQSLSVYIDTLLLCTCSAMMVMVFYVQDPAIATALNGIPLVQAAVNNSFGEIGIHVVTFAIWCFAFSSIIGNYFYAESNFIFITKNKMALFIFRLVCVVVVFVGACNSFDLAWNLADIFMGLMAIINLIVIIILGKWAFKLLDDYSAQRKAGKDPVFVASNIEGLPQTECWNTLPEDLKDFEPGPIEEFAEVVVDAVTTPVDE